MSAKHKARIRKLEQQVRSLQLKQPELSRRMRQEYERGCRVTFQKLQQELEDEFWKFMRQTGIQLVTDSYRERDYTRHVVKFKCVDIKVPHEELHRFRGAREVLVTMLANTICDAMFGDRAPTPAQLYDVFKKRMFIVDQLRRNGHLVDLGPDGEIRDHLGKDITQRAEKFYESRSL